MLKLNIKGYYQYSAGATSPENNLVTCIKSLRGIILDQTLLLLIIYQKKLFEYLYKDLVIKVFIVKVLFIMKKL